MSETENEMPLAVGVCIDILSNLNSYRLSVMLCEFTQKLDSIIHNTNVKAGIAKLNIETGNTNLKERLVTSIMANFENIDIERVEKLLDSDDGYHELIDLLISYYLNNRKRK